MSRYIRLEAFEAWGLRMQDAAEALRVGFEPLAEQMRTVEAPTIDLTSTDPRA